MESSCFKKRNELAGILQVGSFPPPLIPIHDRAPPPLVPILEKVDSNPLNRTFFPIENPLLQPPDVNSGNQSAFNGTEMVFYKQ